MKKRHLIRSLPVIVLLGALVVLDAVVLFQYYAPQAASGSEKTGPSVDSVPVSGSQEAPLKENGQAAPEEAAAGPTLSKFLQKAALPVGHALYVWGGGWNEEDTGAGLEATTIGLPSSWQTFMDSQDASYDFTDYPYEIHDGLDCSGYVGWTLYNTLETRSGEEGYVSQSSETGEDLAARGWGTVIPADEITEYLPGDILFSDGHVTICLGQYADGSVLFVHSAPPSGVQVSGTCDLQGNLDSMAARKAEAMMQEMAPEAWEKFPAALIDWSYLTDYDQFRWNTSLFPDAADIQKLNPEEAASLLLKSVRSSQEQAGS